MLLVSCEAAATRDSVEANGVNEKLISGTLRVKRTKSGRAGARRNHLEQQTLVWRLFLSRPNHKRESYIERKMNSWSLKWSMGPRGGIHPESSSGSRLGPPQFTLFKTPNRSLRPESRSYLSNILTHVTASNRRDSTVTIATPEMGAGVKD